MTHTVRESGPSQHTLTIEVPVEQVESRILEVSRVFQRQVSMPGFRKGKVPLDKVRSEYAAEIEREFLERFIPEVTHEALGEAKLVAVVPPSVTNLRFTPGQPLSFEAVVDVAPQVEVKDWKGYALKRRIKPVAAAQVDGMLDQLREESAVFEDVERPAGPGDVVLLDSQRIDANGRRLSNTKAKGARILLGAPDLLPELEAGLQGAEAGQERTIAVTYPADFRQAELAGQSVRYVVNVKKIQQKNLRALDDTLARDVFGLESLVALRERIQRNLELEDEQRWRRDLEAQAIDELVKRHPMDLSPRLVNYMLEQVVHEQTGSREVSEELHKQLEEHYRPGVERSLKREILLIALAKQENLDVSGEEVGQQILRLAESDPRNAARVRQHYSSADRRRALAESMLEKKALDRVIEAAKIEDEPIAADLPAGQ
ncbi:MAG: trigger factor [Candidatus Eisenbacteria bacterium]|nr:trigger factor [Candidatus Eisenbacteria bacterium]